MLTPPPLPLPLPLSAGLSGGNGICPTCTLAGIAPPGEAKGRGGGPMAWSWEARREGGAEGCRCCEASAWVEGWKGRGEGGTELRSGDMVAVARV
jgi:hypothetical protein